jgi:chitinase
MLYGCTDAKPNNENDKPASAVPSSVDIINLGDKDEVIVGGEKLSLMAFVSPSNASQEVTWTSFDETVATVNQTGEVVGLKEGSTIITATTKNNLSSEITIVVYDDAASLTNIEAVKAMLDEIIPSETTTNIPFIYVTDKARLSWKTSDEDTISRAGKVNRAVNDKIVKLTCTITVSRLKGEFTKDVMVKGYELKSRTNKKLTFTYLYDYQSNFTGFRDGDLDKIDVINYSFGGIVNGKMSISSLANFNKVMQEAHAKGVRVVLAIGGWGVDGFSDAALTSASRKVFVDSVMEGIERYRFDGIDFDWEYPGSTAGGTIKARPEVDKANFTLLIRDLRQAMQAKNPDLILSIAVANGSWAAQTYYEVSKINQYVDFVHVMSYDVINFASPSNPNVNASHHTNLYASQYGVGSAEAGVNAYISRGIDKSKVVMGVAFYGHIFGVTTEGYYGMGGLSDQALKKTISYKKIVEDYLTNNLYQVYTDTAAGAKWIYGKNTVISYDEPDSIAAKCQYVNDKGLGGVMVWEYSKDDDNSTLLKAISNNINPNK